MVFRKSVSENIKMPLEILFIGKNKGVVISNIIFEENIMENVFLSNER